MRSFIFLALFFSLQARALVINGQLANTEQGPGVIKLGIVDPKAREMFFCTSTKIAKNVIITAAHCFYKSQTPAYIFISRLGKNPLHQQTRVKVIKLIVHPSMQSFTPAFDRSDIAVLIIEPTSQFDEIETREIDFERIESGKEVTFWGYGCKKSVHPSESENLKTYGLNLTLEKDALDRNTGSTSFTVRAMKEEINRLSIITGGPTYKEGLPGLCPGDSGGPVFYQEKLVAINSSILFQDMAEDGSSAVGKSVLNLHTRLSEVKAWLEARLQEAATF